MFPKTIFGVHRRLISRPHRAHVVPLGGGGKLRVLFSLRPSQDALHHMNFAVSLSMWDGTLTNAGAAQQSTCLLFTRRYVLTSSPIDDLAIAEKSAS
jgi:hypothetical protein